MSIAQSVLFEYSLGTKPARIAQWLERFLDMEEAVGSIPSTRTLSRQAFLTEKEGLIFQCYLSGNMDYQK